MSQWCHPTISSSVVRFSSCPQSFVASESFPMSQLFASGDQSIGASALAPVLPMNIQGWFPFGLTGLILLSKRLSRDLQHHSWKVPNASALSLFHCPALTSKRASLLAQMVKNLPAMWETQVQSLVQEDLEKGMASHSSILSWRIPWTEEPGRLQSMGLQRVRHDWTTNTFIFTSIHDYWTNHSFDYMDLCRQIFSKIS